MSERDDREVFSPLESAGGTTTIANTIVSQIAGIAAGEVEDVRPAGNTSRRKGGLFRRSKGSPEETRNVSVEVGQTGVAVHLTVGFRYGAKLPEVAERIREKVVNRVENLVGLAVTEVNVSATNIVFPEQEEEGRDDGTVRGGSGSQTGGRSFAGDKSEAGLDKEPHGEPGAREPGTGRAEDSGSGTDPEAENGPVFEGVVRVEDVPVETDETAELDGKESQVEKHLSKDTRHE